MLKSIRILILFFIFIHSANAAFNGLSIHSRANCINNESITWDARWNRTYKTMGHHEVLVGENEPEGEVHLFETGWQDTWRSAAVHWGEGEGQWRWRVVGFHFQLIDDEERVLGMTDVSDCSVYNGWWEKDKPSLTESN